MIKTLLISGVVFAFALTGMALGVILSNRRLRGSCGGMSGLQDANGKPLCEGCSHPSADCSRDEAERE